MGRMIEIAEISLFIGLGLAHGWAMDNDYRQQLAQWRSQRETKLKAEDGWLSVSGLFWLKEGDNRIGSAAGNDIVLPEGGPAEVGLVRLEGNKLTMGGRVLKTDQAGKPEVIPAGRMKLLVLKRGDRYALRLKDPEGPYRKSFTGCKWYPADESWRVVAKLEPADSGRKVVYETIIGTQEELPSAGMAVFQRDGKEYRVELMLEGKELWLVFRDGTSGKTTYGGARELYAEREGVDRVVLDFNKAHNLPCAFIPYATCPIAPKQNRLAVAVEAGELKYKD